MHVLCSVPGCKSAVFISNSGILHVRLLYIVHVCILGPNIALAASKPKGKLRT